MFLGWASLATFDDLFQDEKCRRQTCESRLRLHSTLRGPTIMSNPSLTFNGSSSLSVHGCCPQCIRRSATYSTRDLNLPVLLPQTVAIYHSVRDIIQDRVMYPMKSVLIIHKYGRDIKVTLIDTFHWAI